MPDWRQAFLNQITCIHSVNCCGEDPFP